MGGQRSGNRGEGDVSGGGERVHFGTGFGGRAGGTEQEGRRQAGGEEGEEGVAGLDGGRARR